jgi:membrane protein required for colicin V production
VNILDVVFLIIVILSVLFGILKGLVRELFSLAFFILAVILSFLFYFEVGNIFLSYIKNRDIANFIGFLLVFVVVLIIGALVTYFIKRIFVVGPLKSIDRILGGVFGLIRGILVSAIVLLGLIVFPVNDKLILKSQFSPYILTTVKVVLNLFPGKIKEKFKFFKFEDGQENNRTGRSV